MPIIPYSLLNCAFYLYKDEADALAGKDTGGTGFLVATATEDGQGHQYGVSNYHVAVSGGYSCIRINTLRGLRVVALEPHDWVFEPGGDDVAVVPLDIREGDNIVTFIGSNLLLTPDAAAKEQVAPGDDVFMVGRFVDLDATTTNVPAVRFGNISTLPVEVKQPNGYRGLCYCVDMHSRTGYSGSPVFVYRTPGGSLEWAVGGGPVQIPGRTLLALLGVHCGQFTEELPIRRKRKKRTLGESISERAYEEYIEGMSGMNTVVPAWRVGELLNRKELIARREQVEAERAKSRDR